MPPDRLIHGAVSAVRGPFPARHRRLYSEPGMKKRLRRGSTKALRGPSREPSRVLATLATLANSGSQAVATSLAWLFSRARATRLVNAPASDTAISASILRLISTPAALRPAISRL